MNINACLIFVFRKNITLYAYIKHIIASLLIVDSLPDFPRRDKDRVNGGDEKGHSGIRSSQ